MRHSCSRRQFVRFGATGLGATALALPVFEQWLGWHVSAQEPHVTQPRKRLVVIFQRGAMDGLSAVMPLADEHYRQLRPLLAVAPPKAGDPSTALDLDGRFGLNPHLAPLLPLFQAGTLAVIHGVGSPDGTRSHFDAQDYMESATPGRKGTPDGWLNRYLQAAPLHRASPFRAVSFTQLTPRTLQGKANVIALADIQAFKLQAGSATKHVTTGFEEMYAQAAADALRGTGQESLEAVKFLKRANPGRFQPEHGATYPSSPLGNALRQTAQLIKANVGLEIAFADCGGWDTHANQGAPGQSFGQLNRLFRDFAGAIAAFVQDLGPERMRDTLVLTMTEFGRTVRQNGAGGTDHGRASCMFAVGGSVRGGRVYGDVPKLAPANLADGRDLPVTTDFRTVLAETITHHLGLAQSGSVLPGYPIKPSGLVGFLGR
ncbi:MAG: DUF1501 domain-containing protein [Chloracidobacterium sp.]|uniref:DUF1501 domain-containing protein n=1 Tax=Chloracidobacterium validum TaxID=2821543 RepID=A0ABX8BCG0_9BACT|nr:DUF1501 domain-containing protein [Chloracidobacterium validum]QUW03329.1 DUF1501 domain-containing protein [Chloracidobacterium validum]